MAEFRPRPVSSAEQRESPYVRFRQSVIVVPDDGGEMPSSDVLDEMLSALFHKQAFQDWRITMIDFIYTIRFSIEFILESPALLKANQKRLGEQSSKGVEELRLPAEKLRVMWDITKQNGIEGLNFLVASRGAGHNWTAFHLEAGLPVISEIESNHRRDIRFIRPTPRANPDQDSPECPAIITEMHT